MDRQTVKKKSISCFRFVILILSCAILTTSCGGNSFFSEMQKDVVNLTDVFSFDPEPGQQKMLRGPDEVIEQECANKRLPFMQIVKYELEPYPVEAGSTLKRRVIYTFCPRKSGRVSQGTLTTRLYLDNKLLTSSARNDFTVRSGSWLHIATLDVPGNAASGLYVMEIEFDGREAPFKRRENFVVTQ